MKTIEKRTVCVPAYTLIELRVVMVFKCSSPPPSTDLNVPFLASGYPFRGNQ